MMPELSEPVNPESGVSDAVVPFIESVEEFIDVNRPYRNIRSVNIYESDVLKMPSILSIDLSRKLGIKHKILKNHIEMYAKTSTGIDSKNKRLYGECHYELRYGSYRHSNMVDVNYIYFSVIFLKAYSDEIANSRKYDYWRKLRDFTSKITEAMAEYLSEQLYIARAKEEILKKQIDDMQETMARNITIPPVKSLPAPKRIRIMVSEDKVLDNGETVTDRNERLVECSGNMFKDALLSKGCHLHVRLSKLNHQGNILASAFLEAGLTESDFDLDGRINNMTDDEIDDLFEEYPRLYAVLKGMNKKTE